MQMASVQVEDVVQEGVFGCEAFDKLLDSTSIGLHLGSLSQSIPQGRKAVREYHRERSAPAAEATSGSRSCRH